MLNGKVFVNADDNRSVSGSADAWGGQCYPAPDPGELSGRATFDRDLNAWVADTVYVPTNTDLRKNALTSLSAKLTSDIAQLNLAWLAAQVNDGASEGIKKDAIMSQISSAKAQYATDRAAIIAQYPED